ncbi:uncharacterized protein BYT42DRAFT_583827 [Radiomyces spectabilis]|uniref:uncharacterized protein n=1 Tax=Radiomyces spectabilis TaxID=64574 RepID=UPI00221E3B09|nr:uncharacterized protein BYT42DRAFT_583827 [Radiomyces spectabilis]KAI8369297.1 hypothetical protein BYT42DRAFT_583827 [Radiomyces spectabilis]
MHFKKSRLVYLLLTVIIILLHSAEADLLGDLLGTLNPHDPPPPSYRPSPQIDWPSSPSTSSSKLHHQEFSTSLNIPSPSSSSSALTTAVPKDSPGSSSAATTTSTPSKPPSNENKVESATSVSHSSVASGSAASTPTKSTSTTTTITPKPNPALTQGDRSAQKPLGAGVLSNTGNLSPSATELAKPNEKKTEEKSSYTAAILGSVCGSIALISATLGYAYHRKMRRNRMNADQARYRFSDHRLSSSALAYDNASGLTPSIADNFGHSGGYPYDSNQKYMRPLSRHDTLHYQHPYTTASTVPQYSVGHTAGWPATDTSTATMYTSDLYPSMSQPYTAPVSNYYEAMDNPPTLYHDVTRSMTRSSNTGSVAARPIYSPPNTYNEKDLNFPAHK